MTHNALTPAFAPALALAAALGLAGCSPGGGAPADAPQAPVAAPVVAQNNALPDALLEADGFTPANPGGHGTALKMTFGQPRAEIIDFMTTLHGGTAPTLSHNDECGAGPMNFARWSDAFTLAFQDGKFAGWWADEHAPSGFSTLDDIRVGSTLAQVRAAWPEVQVMNDSIGPEFHAAGLSGTLSGTAPTATVTALWAGASCIFR
ncbi:hypothetical protein [uncultured Brevundimonas sp.]|uniref:hypothetical protein n=1 Tax=uncultured Brevundimonas sp. TaxID=213418 RepID=UPI0030ED2491|tara:strand:+ start:120 stop:734 length:615 start_codon:yes stop_codon:yes gene_type:complete